MKLTCTKAGVTIETKNRKQTYDADKNLASILWCVFKFIMREK